MLKFLKFGLLLGHRAKGEQVLWLSLLCHLGLGSLCQWSGQRCYAQWLLHSRVVRESVKNQKNGN